MRWIAPPEKDPGTTTLERRLWEAADQLRANSGLTSQQYSQPVLGLIFLRFAEARFLTLRKTLETQAEGSRRGSRVDDPKRNPGTGIPTKLIVRDGDVLFSWSADLEVYLWREGTALLNQHLFNVLPHEGYSRAYCYHALAEVMPRFRALSLGTTMHHIKRSALDHVSVIVPPPSLRREFDQTVEPIHGLLVQLSKIILNLRATRDLLLPRLMSGQFTLPEAEEAIPAAL
jgi:hypothetical protein